MQKLIKILQALMSEKFFGEVLIKFQHGEITIVQKTESLKL